MPRDHETPATRAGGSGDEAGGLAAGEEFAGHLIEAELGRGGMGVVYRARHLALDRELALKVIATALSSDETFRARFQREARLAASIDHPNVIPVQDAGEEAGRLYLSMRLVAGSDLDTLIVREGPMGLERAAGLIAAVAAGLDAAHERGLVHRDVKPSNVLVERRENGEQVFVTDFGISRVAGDEGGLTGTGEFLGSPDYAAPEQLEGESLDARTDVYSLGGVAYFVLTGKPPFAGRSGPAKALAHANAPRPRPSREAAVPRGVDAVIARAMAVRPKDRFASARAFASALGLAATGGHAPPRPARRPTRRSAVAGLLVVAAVATAVAGALVLGGSDSDESSVVKGFEVEGTPTGVAVGPQRVWAVGPRPPQVVQISPFATPPTSSAALDVERARAVATGFGSVWIVDKAQNELIRFNASDPQASAVRIPVGGGPTDLSLDERWVWVTNQLGGTVSRVDPNTNRIDRTVAVGRAPHAIATGGGFIWVATLEDSTVIKIDPGSAEVVGQPVPVGRAPSDLAVGHRSIWVTELLRNGVRRLDLADLSPQGTVKTGAQPRDVLTALGSVWVANGGDGTVSRIDPATKAVEETYAVGEGPNALAAGLGAIWVASFADGTVSRITP
jgi:YVTN family beta-propeller protein